MFSCCFSSVSYCIFNSLRPHKREDCILPADSGKFCGLKSCYSSVALINYSLKLSCICACAFYRTGRELQRHYQLVPSPRHGASDQQWEVWIFTLHDKPLDALQLNSCQRRWLMFLPVCRGQELCGQTPRVPREELGARERPTDPNEDRKGEREKRGGRGRRGGRGGWLATSVLWWIQWGRQPHQVRSMKQVCVLVFVSVGVCASVVQLYTFSYFIQLDDLFFLFFFVFCVASFTLCVHVCVCCVLVCPRVWLVFPYHTQQLKLSGFPTTKWSLQKCFPISVIYCWCPRTQQALTFPISSETTHFPSMTFWLIAERNQGETRTHIIRCVSKRHNVLPATPLFANIQNT